MKLSVSMFTVALAAIATAALQAAPPVTGASAPDFVLKSVAGNNIRLSEHRSDVVVLAFTASWCSECRRQDAVIADLHRRYRDAGLVVLAVSLDRERRGAEAVASRVDADLPVLMDTSGEAGRLYDVDELPMIVLIDRAGAVRDVLQGDRRSDDGRTPNERVRTLLREL
jgi:peroxiredoxin